MSDWSASSYQVSLPEIYQIELTNLCNLHCPNCIREDKRVMRPQGYMSLDLIKKMADWGDFENTYFLELQLYGEPLLNPKFYDIVKYLKEHFKFKLGLSTNGILIQENILALLMLDYITVSIDSPIKEEYEMLRPGSSFNKLVQSIDLLYANLDYRPHPIIDLQVIKFKTTRLPALKAFANSKKWDNITCREVPDCFAAYHGLSYNKDEMNKLCLNPYMSVSIQWDGDVVPCCFACGKQIVYGNAYTSTLKDIWENSYSHKLLTRQMEHNHNEGHMPCMYCYQRSPVILHMMMLKENTIGKGRIEGVK
jgi:radical SAM protein with 4Fe4S-binding SPASM domain